MIAQAAGIYEAGRHARHLAGDGQVITSRSHHYRTEQRIDSHTDKSISQTKSLY